MDENITDDQIEELRSRAFDSKNAHGSRYPGMSYEDGIIDAISWLMGDSEEMPLGE